MMLYAPNHTHVLEVIGPDGRVQTWASYASRQAAETALAELIQQGRRHAVVRELPEHEERS